MPNLGKVTSFPCWMGITEFAVQMFHEEFDVQKDYPVYAKDGYIVPHHMLCYLWCAFLVFKFAST